jgi:pantetheine-phosphate adenylyltransferase
MDARVVFPGSFDPVTNGHLDVIERALGICSHLIVAVAVNNYKHSLFTSDERVEMIKGACQQLKEKGKQVEVICFHGLLVDFMLTNNLKIIVRGLRAVSDFENEFQMATMNRSLCPDIDTIFLPAGQRTSFVSSRLIKSVACIGGDVSAYVPAHVSKMLSGKFNTP